MSEAYSTKAVTYQNTGCVLGDRMLTSSQNLLKPSKRSINKYFHIIDNSKHLRDP